MAHPKRKISKARRNKRRSHHAIADITLAKCSKCGELYKYHHVCPTCGYYRDRQVINVAN